MCVFSLHSFYSVAFSKAVCDVLPSEKFWSLAPDRFSVAAEQRRSAGSCRSGCRPACARARTPGRLRSCEPALLLVSSLSSEPWQYTSHMNLVITQMGASINCSISFLRKTYLSILLLHCMSSLQLTKIKFISASVRRPDSDMGL